MRDILNSRGINVYVNTISAQEPLEVETNDNTSSTISLKGLNGFTANKIIKVNSAGNALEYADDSDTQYSAASPLLLTGTEFSLKGLTGFTANKFLKVNSAGNALEYADDNNTTYGATSPLVLTGTTFSLAGLSSLGTAGQFIKINSGGTGFEYGSDNNTTYTAQSPLLLFGTQFRLNQAFFTAIEALNNDDNIVVFADAGTYNKIKYSVLLGLINTYVSNNITISGTLPIIASSTASGVSISFSISQLPNSNGSITSTVCIAEGGSDGSFRNLTLGNLGEVVCPLKTSFGTSISAAGGRTFGHPNYTTNIDGADIKNDTAAFYIRTAGSVNSFSYDTTNKIFNCIDATSQIRLGHTTAVNNFSGIKVSARLSSINDLVLFTPSQSFSGTLNRIAFVAENSATETGMFGYAGSSISIANGGIPTSPTDNTSAGSLFAWTSGSPNSFSVCNSADGSFANTTIQMKITASTGITDFFTSQNIFHRHSSNTVAQISLRYSASLNAFLSIDSAGDLTLSTTSATKRTNIDNRVRFTLTGTSFGAGQSSLTAFPPIGQTLYQTSTTVGQGYLVNTVYRVPSSTEAYWSCFQLQLTSSFNLIGWGTHSGSGTFNQRFYVRSDGNFWGGSNLNTSDRRIKKDIINADGEECINILKSIKLKKYRYNDDWAEQHSIENSNYVYGFIAQDIGANPQISYCMDNKTAPISIDGEDIYDINTIDKSKILTVLWGVCDKQQTEIEALQTKVSTLENEIANIKSHLNL